MIAVENGLLNGSEFFFHTPSETARNTFFYPLCTGHFFCNATYRVERKCYDSFLVMLVVRGSGYLEQLGEKTPIAAGSLALIDCYKPHCYGADSDCEIYWLHLDGVVARRYFELCTNRGFILCDGAAQLCDSRMRRVNSSLATAGKVNEAVLSKLITDLLTELVLCAGNEGELSRSTDAIEETLAFIAENVAQPLPLKELAAYASLSPFYFSRIFKKETGFTPHEYIIRARVDKARYLLKTTDKPLKEIAFLCGFSNECSFSTTFKGINGSTPMSCRNEEARK